MLGLVVFPIWLMEPEPAIDPAFCIHSFSLKLFISVYLRSLDQPARDSPHSPDPGRQCAWASRSQLWSAGSRRTILKVPTQS
jgi:hypothetical protein